MVPVRHEADVLTLDLLGDRLQAEAPRDGPRLGLGLRPDREHQAVEHRTVDSPEEIGLVLLPVQPSVQLAAVDARVVPGRDPIRFDLVGLVHEVAKLRERVTAHARDGRAAPGVLFDEVLDDVAAERALHVEHVVRHAEAHANAARVVDRVERAARPVRDLVAVAEQLHRDADDVVALLDEQRSEEHTSELQSRQYLVCRLLLDKTKTDAWPGQLILPVMVQAFRQPYPRSLLRDRKTPLHLGAHWCLLARDLTHRTVETQGPALY